VSVEYELAKHATNGFAKMCAKIMICSMRFVHASIEMIIVRVESSHLDSLSKSFFLLLHPVFVSLLCMSKVLLTSVLTINIELVQVHDRVSSLPIGLKTWLWHARYLKRNGVGTRAAYILCM